MELDLALRVGATFLALIGAFIARRTWGKLVREYDRSMLIRLGTDRNSRRHARVPVIVGRFPFSDLGGEVRSNLDIRDVIGFVVGEPKWMQMRGPKALAYQVSTRSLIGQDTTLTA